MMRLTLTALALAVALLAAVHGWLGLRGREPAQVRTVELAPMPVERPAEAAEPGPVRAPAVDRGASTQEPVSAPPPEESPPEESPREESPREEEEVVAPTAPFVEAPLAPEDPAAAAREPEPTAPDQDAWAARIRRMLEVYARVGERL